MQFCKELKWIENKLNWFEAYLFSIADPESQVIEGEKFARFRLSNNILDIHNADTFNVRSFTAKNSPLLNT